MKTTDAVLKFGSKVCMEAYALHKEGNGAGTIASMFNLSVNQADCAIDAGRALEEGEQFLIQAVRKIANDRYEQGWSAIVEAWSDGDILEYLSNANMDLPKTLKAIQEWVDIRAEMEDNCRF